MKGVILAGGLGTRLLPMTKVTNKHLLPVYDRPMVYFALQQLVHAAIDDILIVTGGEHAGDFLRLLRNGADFGLRRLHYAYQEGAGGIAEALGLAEEFADRQPVAVMLGDNVFQDPIRPAIDDFRRSPEGAMIFLKQVPDPERFGVAEIDGDRIVGIVEKPAEPASNLAVTGCYLYDASVFDVLRTLERSDRGELEITDVNNHFIGSATMRWTELSGFWSDAGTVASLLRASTLVSGDRDNPVLRLPSDRDGRRPGR